MRIDSSSRLHLPLVSNPAASSSPLLDLRHYPDPFVFDPMMSDLAFVLSPNDPLVGIMRHKLLFRSDIPMRLKMAGLETYYADAIPDEARQERNLIIIGKPSSLEIITELHESLPAPFEPGSDLANENNLDVSYRLGDNVNIGYLELLPSLWKADRSILYVGGSSDVGVAWAANALRFGRLQNQLDGNLAFINGEQIVTADTRISQRGQGALATSDQVNLTPSAGEVQPVILEHPAWMLPAIFIVLGAMLLVLIILGVQALFRKRLDK